MSCDCVDCKRVRCLHIKNNLAVCGKAYLGELCLQSPLNLCGVNLFVDVISPCNPGGKITIEGTVVISKLNVCNITSCSSDQKIIFDSPVVFNKDVTLTSISSIGNQIVYVNAPFQFNQTINFCMGIKGCNGRPLEILNDLSICNGTLFVNTIGGCAGGPINFISQVNFTQPISFTGDVNFCNANVLVNTINPCGANPITINGSVIIPTLFTNSISGVGEGVNFTSPVSICNAPLSVNQITSCTPPSPVEFLTPISTPSIIATNYNLTNINQGLGLSILGNQQGPGGNIRSFKTLASDNGSVAITDGSDSGINLKAFKDYAIQENFLLDIPVPPNTWTPLPIGVNVSNEEFTMQSDGTYDSISGSNFITIRVFFPANAVGLTYIAARFTDSTSLGVRVSRGSISQTILSEPYSPNFPAYLVLTIRQFDRLIGAQVEVWHNAPANIFINPSEYTGIVSLPIITLSKYGVIV